MVSLTRVYNRLARLVNASAAGAYGNDSTLATITDTEAWDSEQIKNAILAADGEVMMRILGTKGHSRRGDYLSSTTLAHGAPLPPHLGEIISVEIGGVVASKKSISRIREDRANVLGAPATVIDPGYFIDDNSVIWHNGSGNATVKYVNFVRGSTPQSPDEYEDLVFVGAGRTSVISRLVHADIGGLLNSYWDRGMQMIPENRPLDPLELTT